MGVELERLPKLAEKLYVYDVVQGAWEHESEGDETNIRHVSYHLAKDVLGKNFNDPVTACTEITPDSVQYALRLARWSNLRLERILPDPTDKSILATIRGKHGFTPRGHLAFMKASNLLSGNMHDADHKTTREKALYMRPTIARDAAAMLLLCADIQSDQHGFNLETAFDDRLSALRQRFNIPEVQKATTT